MYGNCVVDFGARKVRYNGYNEFRKALWHEFAGGGSWKEQIARMASAWRSLDRAEKDQWKEKAKDAVAHQENLSNSIASFVDSKQSPEFQSLGYRKRRTLATLATAASISDMANHDVFKAGFQTASFEAGIKSSHVLDVPDAVVDKSCMAMFSFDPIIKTNPSRAMKPHKPCALQHGGLCPGINTFSKKGDIACKNLYALLMQHELKAKECKY